MNIRTRDEGRYHIREMLVDDQLVSWLTIIDYQMRIGSAVVRMAGIGGVETHHKHRMQGHMRVLFEDTVQYMLAQGYDVSMLFGIPNFYPKFGYAVCLSWPKAMIQTRDAELAQTEAAPCNVRPVKPDDLPAIIDLYNQRNASRTCSLVRTPEHFKGFPKGTEWDTRSEAITLEDEQGGFAGYAAWDKSDQAVNVVEVESISPSFYPALLYEFARQAIARRCGHIAFFMPPDHPFAQFVQRYGCEWSIKYMCHSDGMMRILNQASLIDKITPELKRRAAQAHVHSGAMTIQTELGTTTVLIHDGTGPSAPPEAAIKLPQSTLAQLVAGYRSAHDILNDPQVSAHGEMAPLLDVLFPQCQPYMWAADHF